MRRAGGVILLPLLVLLDLEDLLVVVGAVGEGGGEAGEGGGLGLAGDLVGDGIAELLGVRASWQMILILSWLAAVLLLASYCLCCRATLLSLSCSYLAHTSSSHTSNSSPSSSPISSLRRFTSGSRTAAPTRAPSPSMS